MNSLDVLRGARDLINGSGWTQGDFYNCDGYCLDGALLEANLQLHGTRLQDRVTFDTYYEARELLRGGCFGDVIGWNDEPGRTKEEVVDLLDRVIEKVSNG
jgi:hypothetical protein